MNSCFRTFPAHARLVLLVLTVGTGWQIAEAPADTPAQVRPSPLTVKQKERIQQRDRYDVETARLRSEGKLDEAIVAASKMLAIERDVFGNFNEDVAGSLQQLAEMCARCGDFTAARKAEEEVQAIQTKLYGPADWRVVDARVALVRIQRLTGLNPPQCRELAEADDLLKQVVKLRSESKFREAIPLAERCVSIRKRLLGNSDPLYADALLWLGYLCKLNADYAKAKPIYRQAMEIRKQVLGEKHPDYATSLNNLAMLYCSMGDYAKAELLYRQAMEIRKQTLGKRHPDYAASVDNLVNLLTNAASRAEQHEDFVAAHRARNEALDLRNKQYGSSDWRTIDAQVAVTHLDRITRATPQQRKELAEADALLTQAVKLRSQKKSREAVALAERCAAIRKRLLGDADVIYADALAVWGLLENDVEDHAKAEPVLRQALDLRKSMLGENHPNYVTSLYNLAFAYAARQDYAMAEPLYRHALVIQRRHAGEKDRAYSLCLDNLIYVLTHLATQSEQGGDLSAARGRRQELVDLQTKQHGLADWRTTDARLALSHVDRLTRLTPAQRRELAEADNLLKQAAKLRSEKKSREAVALAERCAAIRKPLLGDSDAAYADALAWWGLLEQDLEDYTKAEPVLRQALDLRKSILGENHPDYVISLYNLAVAYAARQDYTKAEPMYRQAMKIQKQVAGESSIDYACSVDLLATLYHAMGDFTRAEPLYRQALEIRRQVLGEKHLDYADTLGRLAGLYHSTGDYVKAEPLYHQALEIRKQVSGEDSPLYASSLSELAGLCHSMGDYTQAKRLLCQALEIQKRSLGEKSPAYAKSLSFLAALYKEMKDYGKSEPLYHQAMEIFTQAGMERSAAYTTTLNNLALLYEAMGDCAKSESLYRQALEIERQVRGEKTLGYATELGNLAALYYFMENYAKAEPLYRQGLEIEKQVRGERNLSYATSLNNLALLYAIMKQPARGEPLSRRALAIARQNLDLTAAVQSERQQLAMTQMVRWHLDSYLYVTMAAKVPPEQVYREVLACKGVVWTRQQWTRRMRQDRAGTENPEAAKLYADLEQASRALANLTRSNTDSQHGDEHRRKLDALSEDVERLQRRLAAASQPYRQQVMQQNRTTADIQQALPPGAALVDFIEHGHCTPPKPGTRYWKPTRHLTAFVVRRDQPIQRADLGPADAIGETVEKWRSTYSADDAATLKRLLWKPLEPFLRDVKLVLVSPDGALARFPMAALPGKQPGSYQIEDLAIGVLPVPQLLPELVARDKVQRDSLPSMLLVGEVDYDAAPGQAELGWLAQAAPRTRGGQLMQWAPLRNTRQEIVSIRDSFDERFPDGRCKLLRKDQAVGAEVRSEINHYRYVHFATHGFFAPSETPSVPAAKSDSRRLLVEDTAIRQEIVDLHPGLLSGLVLAGANRPAKPGQDDGILTALEVAELDLSHVDLATLSACETGLGKSAAGEGLLGLQRAFQVAGAHSVVATLWTIRDDAGRQLMIDFYENLWAKKMSKVEALRAAQLEMLREGVKRGLDVSERPADQHHRLPPWYWAGFVLSGDWQ